LRRRDWRGRWRCDGRLTWLAGEQALALVDMLLRIGLLVLAQLLARAQILLKVSEGLCESTRLLVTSGLVVDVCWIFCINEQLGKNRHALGIVARKALHSCRALFGFDAFCLSNPRAEKKGHQQKQTFPEIHGHNPRCR